jgi:HEAT repeat protein
MGSHSQEVRLKAIAYLGQQPKRESVDVLLKVATLDPNAEPPIQRGALDALGGLAQRSPEVQEILAHLVETVGEPNMRQLAADILGIPLEPTDAPAGGSR